MTADAKTGGTVPQPGRFTVPAGHPSLPGHFPGRPVVPGVLLLDAVFRAAAPAVPIRLIQAKFALPVAPGEEVSMAFDRTAPHRLAFACHCGGRRVLWGEFVCAQPKDGG